MAEENHDEIAEMLLSLQDNENSPSTLSPTLGMHTNDNLDEFSNPKQDVNLQLSLGGFYEKTPNSAPTLATSFSNSANSMLKRSRSEQNKFLPEEVAEIQINKEIQVITKPTNQEAGSAETSINEKSNEVDIPIWVAQSAFGNPAFQRAINVIKSNGIPSTPISRNLRSNTSRINPHEVEGSPFSIIYQAINNGKPIGTHINNGTNHRLFVPQRQPENVNSVAPVDFASACRNFIPNQQSQTLRPIPPFNGSLATLAPFGIRGHNINSIMPQNAMGYNKPHIPSNFFPNVKAPPFLLPISNNTNIANGNLFMPYQPSQPFARPIPLPADQVINIGSRVHQNSMNPLEYPCKRARHDNYPETSTSGDGVELAHHLMKQLPTVVTTGGNPNGKKTEGLLYKYGSDQDVTIICVCHGCFFTPEEFVRHAAAGGGGGGVENPRQHINVLDYPDYLRK